jgi:LPS export ABC transporter protein LptC
VQLRGNVVLVSSDGLRLETDRLNWDADEQRAWTQGPVVIYRSGAVVHGTGFESRVAEEVTNIKGRVRATFKRGPMPEPVAPGSS